MQPNSDVSFLSERKASDVDLESVLKSILSNYISLHLCKAKCKSSASPTSTGRRQGCVTIFANTKLTSDSRIQMPIPVRLRELEKAASMFHLYLPGIGCCHRLPLSKLEVEDPSRGDDKDRSWVVVTGTSSLFASCQSTTMFRAGSTTVALVSVTSSQILRLRCFQMLQITAARR